MTKLTQEEIGAMILESQRKHYRDLQAQPARRPHRAKAESAFGASVLARMCEQIAPEAQRLQARNAAITEAKLLERNARTVVGHMKKALALIDEALEARAFGDGRGWRRLQGALESALVDARSTHSETKATFQGFLQETRRRGAPSVRTDFVRLGSRLATASPASWAHLGIAAGVDDVPKSEAKLRELREDYRRLLKKARP